MKCCNCGTDNSEGTSNFDLNVDVPKVIDPDTGTTKKWLTYAIDAKALDQLFLKELRYIINRLNPTNISLIRQEMYQWGVAYIKLRFPKPILECGDVPNAKNLEVRPINLHDTWDAEHPEWYTDEWLPEGFWDYYDVSFEKLLLP